SATAARPKLWRGPRPGDRKNRALQCSTQGMKQRDIHAWEIIPKREGDRTVFESPSEYGGARLPAAQASYAMTALLRQGFYTHRQRSYWANVLLQSRPHIGERLAKRFPEVIVDEAQDS